MRKLWNLLFSDLNLNGDSPVRVRPVYGECGPAEVPTTAQKKRLRIWVSLAFVAGVTAVSWLGTQFYQAMMGGA